MKRFFHYFFVTLITFSIATPSPAYTQTIQVSTSASLSQKVQEIEEFMQFKRILTVDQILDFVDSLEDDEQIEMLTEQELAVVMRFVTFLARNGVLPNDQCDEYLLENDIDFTKAGRALMKHGYREGSVFPKPIGNPAQINEHGQKILERIIAHPERVIVRKNLKVLGEVVDIHAPELGGVRFSPSGEMIGFLEP